MSSALAKMPIPTPMPILAPSDKPLPEGSSVDSVDVAVAAGAVAAVSGRIDVDSCGLDNEVSLVEVATDDGPRVYW